MVFNFQLVREVHVHASAQADSITFISDGVKNFGEELSEARRFRLRSHLISTSYSERLKIPRVSRVPVESWAVRRGLHLRHIR